MNNGATGAAVGVDVPLRVLLGGSKECELFKMRHRAAEGEAWIDIAVIRAGNAVIVGEPVIGIKLAGSGKGVDRAMVLRSTRLGHTGYYDWSIGLVRAEIRSLNLHFRNHCIIDILQVGAEVACVRQAGAVEFQGYACHGRAVGSVRRLLSNLYIREIRGCVRRAKGANGKSRQGFFQFS